MYLDILNKPLGCIMLRMNPDELIDVSASTLTAPIPAATDTNLNRAHADRKICNLARSIAEMIGWLSTSTMRT
jgi:hypothetical protein